MRLFALARAHSRVARRQQALWFTAIPLTLFAWSLAVISPARPNTGGIEDLAFTGQMLAIFTGIAYAAAFTDFFTAPSRLHVDELEASTPIPPLHLRTARLLGTLGVVIAPSAGVLLLAGVQQTFAGHAWAIIGSSAVAVTIVTPAALIAMSLSALAGVILSRALGRIAAVLVWFFLIFSTPLVPLPTLNGSILAVNGDAVVTGYFGAGPFYPPTGLLAYDGSAWTATLSLLAQFVVVLLVLAAGSALAGRAAKR